jgi:CheY-like chemotaxis protein
VPYTIGNVLAELSFVAFGRSKNKGFLSRAYRLLPRARSVGIEQGFGWMAAGILILVVEDDLLIRDLICKTLSKQGYQVVKASDGGQALKLLCAHRFDLVITDLLMPKITGPKLVEELHSLYPRIPIILMTGYPSVIKTQYNTKPFQLAV